jgi:tRNA uridine 5-carbamoylmethylation protein Kti12
LYSLPFPEQEKALGPITIKKVILTPTLFPPIQSEKNFLGSRKNFSNESFVWATFRKRIHDYAHINDDVTVILDAINAKNEYRQEFVEKTPEFDIHHLVYLKKSLAVALAQNALRSKEMIVPPEIIANYFAHIEEPNPLIHDLYTKVEIIN